VYINYNMKQAGRSFTSIFMLSLDCSVEYGCLLGNSFTLNTAQD